MQINKNECNYIDIARVLGIYLVILGHFPYSDSNLFYKNFIYVFHMPLFFAISGILHRHIDFNLDALKKVFISLIIPFAIYNIIYLPMALYFPNKEITLFAAVKGTLLCIGEINAPTWFLISLFGVKVVSLFLKSRSFYVALSLVCLLILIILNIYEIPGINVFRFKATLAAFPFFVFGYLIKDKLNININIFIKMLFVFVSAVFIYWFTVRYGRVNLGSGKSGNILFYYIAGILGIVSTFYISQILNKHIKFQWVKTISRGTMMIVGLHWFITDIFKLYYPDIHFIWAVIASLIITLLFYYPIKVTYNRVPILFGKTK